MIKFESITEVLDFLYSLDGSGIIITDEETVVAELSVKYDVQDDYS